MCSSHWCGAVKQSRTILREGFYQDCEGGRVPREEPAFRVSVRRTGERVALLPVSGEHPGDTGTFDAVHLNSHHALHGSFRGLAVE